MMAAVDGKRKLVGGEGLCGSVVCKRRRLHFVESKLLIASIVGEVAPSEGIEIHVGRLTESVGGVLAVYAHILPFLQHQAVAFDGAGEPKVWLRVVQTAEEHLVTFKHHADVLSCGGVGGVVVCHLIVHCL